MMQYFLDVDDVMDESQTIRPSFRSRNGLVPHGCYTVHRENGSRLLDITYRYGVVHGPFVDYWPNGTVASEGLFEDGKREGIWHFYNQDGTLYELIRYIRGVEHSVP